MSVPDGLTFEFRLEGFGWAKLVVSNSIETNTIDTISYCTDALDDLILLAIQIATGAHFSFALFDHEPRVTILVAQTGWDEEGQWQTGARIVAFEGWSGLTAPSFEEIQQLDQRFLFDAETGDSISHAILKCAERVLEEHGTDGYSKLWNGHRGFPIRGLAALRAALRDM